MSWDYTYTKDVEVDILEDMIKLTPSLATKFLHGKITGLASLGATDNLKLSFSSALDGSEKADLDAVVDSYSSSHMIVAAYQTMHAVSKKQSSGFELYQRIFGLINSQGGLGTIDGGKTAYLTYLIPIRNMLKDGAPEFALRHMIKEIIPAGLFSTEVTDTCKAWIRRYAHEQNTAMDYATYDAILDAIETAPDGTI